MSVLDAKATTTVAFTDGACKGNPGAGGWGTYLVFSDGSTQAWCGGAADTTNNRMELMGAIQALENSPSTTALEIWTDSSYVKNGITQWIEGWKQKGWKTAGKKPVANQDLWQRLDELRQSRAVSWHWVKGHAGHAGNEKADELANLGVERVLQGYPEAHLLQAQSITPTLSTSHPNPEEPSLSPTLKKNLVESAVTDDWLHNDPLGLDALEEDYLEEVDLEEIALEKMDDGENELRFDNERLSAAASTYQQDGYQPDKDMVAANVSVAEADAQIYSSATNYTAYDSIAHESRASDSSATNTIATASPYAVGSEDSSQHSDTYLAPKAAPSPASDIDPNALVNPQPNSDPMTPDNVTNLQMTNPTPASESVLATAIDTNSIDTNSPEIVFDGDTSRANPYFVPLLPQPKHRHETARQLIMDTETTGLDATQGDRIIEVGIVELVGRKFTGEKLHVYINPERSMDEDAIRIHGISEAFLQDKPKFAEVAQTLFDFMDGAEVIAHNAPFDIGFLSMEFDKVGLTGFAERVTVTDSLVLAKQQYPGQRNTLDALVKRLNVGKQDRTFHGALLDAEILAEVYLAMTGGQVALAIDEDNQNETGGVSHHDFAHLAAKLVAAPTDTSAHLNWFESLKDQYPELNNVWGSGS